MLEDLRRKDFVDWYISSIYEIFYLLFLGFLNINEECLLLSLGLLSLSSKFLYWAIYGLSTIKEFLFLLYNSKSRLSYFKGYLDGSTNYYAFNRYY